LEQTLIHKLLYFDEKNTAQYVCRDAISVTGTWQTYRSIHTKAPKRPREVELQKYKDPIKPPKGEKGERGSNDTATIIKCSKLFYKKHKYPKSNLGVKTCKHIACSGLNFP